jgi:Spy/CpxP family protein refolding chaperone
MRSRMILLGFAVVFAGGLTTAAKADEPKELTDPFQGMGNPKRELRGADLTEAQMAEILDFRKATTWEREKQVTKECHELWQQFDELYLSAAPLDEAKAMSLAERAEKLSAEEELLKARVMLKMRSVLTPAQMKRVLDTHQKMKELDAQRDALEAQKKALEPTVASERGK